MTVRSVCAVLLLETSYRKGKQSNKINSLKAPGVISQDYILSSGFFAAFYSIKERRCPTLFYWLSVNRIFISIAIRVESIKTITNTAGPAGARLSR